MLECRQNSEFTGMSNSQYNLMVFDLKMIRVKQREFE